MKKYEDMKVNNKNCFIRMSLHGNPEDIYGDYEHSIEFYEDGKIEFLDYSGQMTHAMAVGNYTIRQIDACKKISFKNIRFLHPYDESWSSEKIPDFDMIALEEETDLTISSPYDTSSYSFNKKYHFLYDPFAIFRTYCDYFHHSFIPTDDSKQFIICGVGKKDISSMYVELFKTESTVNGIYLSNMTDTYYELDYARTDKIVSTE